MPEGQPRKLSDFEPLTPAEQKVLAELDTGQVTVLGGGKLPAADADPERRLRAQFVRWLALGCEGDEGHRLHKKGLRVAGALIVSDGSEGAETHGLDLEGCRLAHDVALMFCRFEDQPLLRSAVLRSIFLNASALPGLSADRIRTEGGVFLRGTKMTGEVQLLGGNITGNLDCACATLSNPEGPALNADRLRMAGDVLLRGTKVTGEVRLLGSNITGNLDCTAATLSNPEGPALNADRLRTAGDVLLRGTKVAGEARLLGSNVTGNLDCISVTLSNPKGSALSADGAGIAGSFMLHAGEGANAKIDGILNFVAAEISTITDDPCSWPTAPGSLVLNRCVYGAFTGHAVNARERLRWLALQDPAQFGQDFWPQPYEQCAKVLREMGHADDAREILIEKERLQRAAERRRLMSACGWQGKMYAVGRGLWDWFLDRTIRYGQRPLFALWWVLRLWLFSAALFWGIWNAGQFKPNNSVILRSVEWYGCAVAASADSLAQSGESQLDCFLRQPQAQGYPAFNAGIYALDVLAPVVDLEQQRHWIPDEDQWGGWFAKGWFYVEIAMGWLLSLLAVAGFSGLIKSD